MTRLKNFSRALGRVLAIIVGTYGALMALFLLLRPLLGEAFLPVALFNHWLPALFFPSFVLLLACLILRHKRLMLLQTPALLGFMLLYSDVLLPPPSTVEPGETQFTLLTYNIQAQNLDYAAVENVIRDVDADVVIVQEIIFEAAEYLEPALADVYPYFAANTDIEQGVFSRYPLLEETTWNNPYGLYQRFSVEVDSQPVVIYNGHIYPPFWWKRGIFDPNLHHAEVDDLLARAAQEEGAVLLGGDFNMSDQSRDYAQIRIDFDDAFRAEGGGLGLTIPSNLPAARSDYVFYNSDVVPVAARVWGESGGSDHFPVWVQLSLADE